MNGRTAGKWAVSVDADTADAVLRHRTVVSHQCCSFDFRLGKQQMVKRVTVIWIARQSIEFLDMQGLQTDRSQLLPDRKTP